MFDDDNGIFGKIVGGIVGIVIIIFLLTVIFGNSTCSQPKQRKVDPGYTLCDRCNGTGYISSKEVNIPVIGRLGYTNEKCPKCNGTGEYLIIHL